MTESSLFPFTDHFIDRHIGPSADDISDMLGLLELDSLETLVEKTLPAQIRLKKKLDLKAPMSERECIQYMSSVFAENQSFISFIGTGYADTITPPVIQRNILENPGWYTQYTPYQAEIAQGRLEALFNFQTMLCDLTGMDIANASMLDESTAAAEAISMAIRTHRKNKSRKFYVSEQCHPQTIEVIKTRARLLDIEIEIGNYDYDFTQSLGGAVIQTPDTKGELIDLEKIASAIHDNGGALIVISELIALPLIEAPGRLGADIVVGSAQRFGVPLGYGGPHAGFMTAKEAYKRQMPGRIIGQSIDADGNPALRLALQTREQHIRREKATSNICTAQVLLAVMASMYAVYHGPQGLKNIASRIHRMTVSVAELLEKLGYFSPEKPFFDTLCFDPGPQKEALLAAAKSAGFNFRLHADGRLGLTIDETHNDEILEKLARVLCTDQTLIGLSKSGKTHIAHHQRKSTYLQFDVFKNYHSETDFLRYMHRLQAKDLSLVTSMIALGSCTMKLNATTEMLPLSFASVGAIHPFAPLEQVKGYTKMLHELEDMLSEITGMEATSLQPNSGAQGEYAGMLAISAYHTSRGESSRNICLLPASAHGTNPASAVMAGMKVVIVKCDEAGNIDVADLKEKAEKHSQHLSAIMITYPSTHGVFEEGITQMCDLIHEHGAQVYLDGANMNAQLGLSRPGDYGADVCHLNLHKTFAIPHGGGGPGMGPICVKPHLAPFLPSHPIIDNGRNQVGPVSAAPWGSASVLPIPWAYILMTGSQGLKTCGEVAILNANYMAKRLEKDFDVLYRGAKGMNAHEFILDTRGYKKTCGVEVVDIAKRLMDYGFHAPTVSFPVPGTLMIEPTESESKEELDRFCDALISIRKEIQKIEDGHWPQDNNPLKNAPHSAQMISADEWDCPYPRSIAAFPSDAVKAFKFWPAVRRINDAHGDRNLICSCPPTSSYQD